MMKEIELNRNDPNYPPDDPDQSSGMYLIKSLKKNRINIRVNTFHFNK